eukprot:TRINITY_DN3435_c0_g1_i2.p1 TRINITY_DN3435_c0_g1~~TRINITY_DN3435_c0_g1_i2.p1  ORF type:complete len:904 (-),score=174.87 TRINITY_DN3435_c0_g1_i2:486-2894(-)
MARKFSYLPNVYTVGAFDCCRVKVSLAQFNNGVEPEPLNFKRRTTTRGLQPKVKRELTNAQLYLIYAAKRGSKGIASKEKLSVVTKRFLEHLEKVGPESFPISLVSWGSKARQEVEIVDKTDHVVDINREPKKKTQVVDSSKPELLLDTLLKLELGRSPDEHLCAEFEITQEKLNEYRLNFQSMASVQDPTVITLNDVTRFIHGHSLYFVSQLGKWVRRQFNKLTDDDDGGYLRFRDFIPFAQKLERYINVLKNMRLLFDLLDNSKDGSITRNELVVGLPYLNINSLPAKQKKTLFDQVERQLKKEREYQENLRLQREKAKKGVTKEPKKPSASQVLELGIPFHRFVNIMKCIESFRKSSTAAISWKDYEEGEENEEEIIGRTIPQDNGVSWFGCMKDTYLLYYRHDTKKIHSARAFQVLSLKSKRILHRRVLHPAIPRKCYSFGKDKDGKDFYLVQMVRWIENEKRVLWGYTGQHLATAYLFRDAHITTSTCYTVFSELYSMNFNYNFTSVRLHYQIDEDFTTPLYSFLHQITYTIPGSPTEYRLGLAPDVCHTSGHTSDEPFSIERIRVQGWNNKPLLSVEIFFSDGKSISSKYAQAEYDHFMDANRKLPELTTTEFTWNFGVRYTDDCIIAFTGSEEATCKRTCDTPKHHHPLVFARSFAYVCQLCGKLGHGNVYTCAKCSWSIHIGCENEDHALEEIMDSFRLDPVSENKDNDASSYEDEDDEDEDDEDEDEDEEDEEVYEGSDEERLSVEYSGSDDTESEEDEDEKKGDEDEEKGDEDEEKGDEDEEKGDEDEDEDE